MSKQGNRKITVDLPKPKDSNRPSVFERLGTKKSSGTKKTSEHCRQWAQHGSCAYGKSCKFAATHVLISPSKQRAANKDSELKRIGKDDNKSRLLSTVVVRSGEGEIDNWDQNDLEYADADVLEKRRQELQRELELQLKMDGKDSRKDKTKVVTYSSTSRSSSSSSMSSSSSDRSSSSSSTARAARRKGRKVKPKRNSSSSSDDGPPKKKLMKGDSKRDKSLSKKSSAKKDDRLKKQESKKKDLPKGSLRKRSLSPSKKSGGTPPISSKNLSKSSTSKHNKSPPKRDKRSPSKDKDRKDRDRGRARSRSPRKARSRTPRKHGSRVVSPKKQVKKDGSSDRHRKRSASRDRDRRDHKDKSLERRKDKHDDKDRHDRKDRGRDRPKEKRDESKRRGRDRRADKGLEKPSKPMERLLPRPEERMAALAAISNKTTDVDKRVSVSKDRTDSERGGRKQERTDRESSKRDRMGSMDRGQGDYEMDRPYERGRSIERYDRGEEHYESAPRQEDRSPSYSIQGRERHYDSGFDMPAPSRGGYEENDDRMYGDHRGEVGYDERRSHRGRSWEGRAGSIDRERGYMHPPHKEWDNDDYRAGGDWQRDRRWPPHDPQMNEWGDKEQEMDAWHHRGHPGPHRGRPHENYGRGMRMDVNKRRGPPQPQPRPEPEPAKQTPPPVQVAPPVAEVEDKPIPDDLSEISDDPDDILNRDDMVDQVMDEDSQVEQPAEEGTPKPETSEKESTQDTSAVGDEKESPEARDDDSDLEEISDGELEEERTRAGLGDALGVDWASLVADVRRREQTAPSTGARNRWKPERVLARVGLSVAMAGKETVQEILNKNAETLKEEQNALKQSEDGKSQENGVSEEIVPQDVESLHPVGAIQVSMEKRKRHRAVLFGTGCEITRALSARRDLALRRYLCNLPPTERSGQSRVTPQPSLFEAARSLFLQAPVTG